MQTMAFDSKKFKFTAVKLFVFLDNKRSIMQKENIDGLW